MGRMELAYAQYFRKRMVYDFRLLIDKSWRNLVLRIIGSSTRNPGMYGFRVLSPVPRVFWPKMQLAVGGPNARRHIVPKMTGFPRLEGTMKERVPHCRW